MSVSRSRSSSQSTLPPVERKASGILRSDAPPILQFELPPLAEADPARLTNTLSIRCTCGYEKRDVICLGELMEEDQRLFQFCGGLFVIRDNAVECNRCRRTASCVQFCCAFCHTEESVSLLDVLRSAPIRADDVHSTHLVVVGGGSSVSSRKPSAR